MFDLCEDTALRTQPPPAVPTDTPQTPRAASTAARQRNYSAEEENHAKVTPLSPANAGRDLFSTACTRIHRPPGMPELEKIKHSYASPSILNTFSFADYIFQMKATEGRKT